MTSNSNDHERFTIELLYKQTGMLPAASPTKYCKFHSFADENDVFQKDLYNKKHPKGCFCYPERSVNGIDKQIGWIVDTQRLLCVAEHLKRIFSALINRQNGDTRRMLFQEGVSLLRTEDA